MQSPMVVSILQRELDLSGNLLSSEAGSRLLHAIHFDVSKHPRSNRLWFLRLAGNPKLRLEDRKRISMRLRWYRAEWSEDRAPTPLPASSRLPSPSIPPRLSAERSDSIGPVAGAVKVLETSSKEHQPLERKENSPSGLSDIASRVIPGLSTTGSAVESQSASPTPSTPHQSISTSATFDTPSNFNMPEKSNTTIKSSPPLPALSKQLDGGTPFAFLESISYGSEHSPSVVALFASPLVYYVPYVKGPVPMDPLNFYAERRCISEALRIGADNARRSGRATDSRRIMNLMRQISSSSLESATASRITDHTRVQVAAPMLSCRFLSVQSLQAVITEASR